ncbi:MAG: hypothetical protein QOD60_1665, partial [Solirubrobacterales bacterium]|nr:hypothetical protein [Solirubrobacterales bacterium]
TTDAAARLATISDNTELGSGFRVAMRDLEIRGAGNLLGDEQSGHVAAVGFELYVQMLEETVEEMQASRDPKMADAKRSTFSDDVVRLDVEVDAYVPPDYVPYEAAKIDIHRRIAGARDRSELARLRAELGDRFGEPPEPVENLIELQRARIELGELGVEDVQFRGGRLSLSPVELDSDEVAHLRERLPEAIYEWRQKTLAWRAPGEEPAARLAALLSLVAALAGSRAPVAA